MMLSTPRLKHSQKRSSRPGLPKWGDLMCHDWITGDKDSFLHTLRPGWHLQIGSDLMPTTFPLTSCNIKLLCFTCGTAWPTGKQGSRVTTTGRHTSQGMDKSVSLNSVSTTETQPSLNRCMSHHSQFHHILSSKYCKRVIPVVPTTEIKGQVGDRWLFFFRSTHSTHSMDSGFSTTLVSHV
jgi:hypothetical protein